MSIHPDLIELMHADIDGLASEAEQRSLREAIARDPEVRDEYRRLRGLSDILARVAPEMPEDDLVPSVLRRVRAHRSATKAGFFPRMLEAWPGGRVAIRYAYAVAAGALIGIVAVHVATGGRLLGPAVPDRDASATLLPKPGASRLDLTAAGVSGYVTLAPAAKTGSGADFGLDVTANEPVELVVRYTPADGGGKLDVSVVKDGAPVPAGSILMSPAR
jgi:anti-sigma factor RsiW